MHEIDKMKKIKNNKTQSHLQNETKIYSGKPLKEKTHLEGEVSLLFSLLYSMEVM
jgi:hypothetical protein